MELIFANLSFASFIFVLLSECHLNLLLAFVQSFHVDLITQRTRKKDERVAFVLKKSEWTCTPRKREPNLVRLFNCMIYFKLFFPNLFCWILRQCVKFSTFDDTDSHIEGMNFEHLSKFIVSFCFCSHFALHSYDIPLFLSFDCSAISIVLPWNKSQCMRFIFACMHRHCCSVWFTLVKKEKQIK